MKRFKTTGSCFPDEHYMICGQLCRLRFVNNRVIQVGLLFAVTMLSCVLRGERDVTLTEGWRFAKDASDKADWSAEAFDDSSPDVCRGRGQDGIG